MRPLAIDLFCGLGGWTEGLLAEGYRVVGFDIERHVYGEARYPAQLVLQDVLTIHGRQFKDAALIVASPPCQAYSYRAMPWKRAKALPPPDNSLFEACFRIQREAIAATHKKCHCNGHMGDGWDKDNCWCCHGSGFCPGTERYIPLVVENVCGAQKWVGRARWHYGSFYLWGDVPALMPVTRHMRAAKNDGGSWFAVAHNTTSGHSQNPDGRKTTRHLNIRDGHSHTRHLTNQDEHGVKVSGDWFGSYAAMKAKGTISPGRLHGKGSRARAAASAHIAKIPRVLARHIAAVYHPRNLPEVFA
jgi:hypothetical protein